MKLPMNTVRRRPGFTLIEMLLVVAIIAILIAMLLPAIFGAVAKAKQTSNRSDISQLTTQVQTFMNDWKVDYLPSRIRLCERLSYYPSNPVNAQLDKDSVEFLTRMFPRIGAINPATGLTYWEGGIDWDGDGVIASPGPGAILEGDQCLVFFLGGIPGGGPYGPNRSGPAKVLGFSTNPTNPADFSAPLKPPLFEFQEARLVDIHPTTAPGFYSYQDPYRNTINAGNGVFGVYAYFSSYKQRNGYNRYFNQLGISDCQLLVVWPYAESVTPTAVQYLNPNSFQIISAGADGMFGQGTAPPNNPTWTTSTASTSPAIFNAANKRVGADDMSNFYDSLLGYSQ